MKRTVWLQETKRMRFDAPHPWYRRDGGQRSYSWVKNTLQAAKVVKKAAKRGAHRKRRERRD